MARCSWGSVPCGNQHTSGAAPNGRLSACCARVEAGSIPHLCTRLAGAVAEVGELPEAEAEAAAAAWQEECQVFTAIYGQEAALVAPRHVRLQLALPPETGSLVVHQPHQVGPCNPASI